MSCFLSFVLLLCLVTVDLSSAIRGERRRLQLLAPPKVTKCRPLPTASPPLLSKNSDSPSASPSLSSNTAATAAPFVDLPYCTEAPTPSPKALNGLKADCLALKKGILPKSFDSSIDGFLKVDLSYDESPAKVLSQVSDLLQQDTSAAVAGCSPPPPAPLLNGPLQNATLPPATVATMSDTSPTIVGVNFSDISIGSPCVPVNHTLNCSEVTCNVEILYDGEANATEQAAMFELVKAAIESQASQGSFGSIGELSFVETGAAAIAASSGQLKWKSCGSLMAGVMTGAVAILCALLSG